MSTFLVYKVKKCLLKSGKVKRRFHRLLPHYGIILPFTWAISCHCQAQNDTSGEKKSPLSFLLFTLHQIVWNPDKHWGSERWRVGSTLHHPSPTLHLDILFSVRRLSSARRPSGFAIRCKKMFDLWNRGICNPPSIYKQLAKKSGVKSGEEPSALFTLPNQLIHKYLRHSGEGWRVFLKVADNRYKLQRITNPQRKGRTFFNSGLQIRWDA